MFEYYGANINSILKINKLLNLDASGEEQDWEFELADPNKVNFMIDTLIKNDQMTVDDKSALSLLIIASLEEKWCIDPSLSERLKDFILFLKKNREVRKRMFFYWVKLGIMNNDQLKEMLFGGEKMEL